MGQHRSVLQSISYAFGKNVNSLTVKRNVLKCQLNSFLFFVLYITERGVLKFLALTVDLFISPYMSVGFCFLYLKALILGA